MPGRHFDELPVGYTVDHGAFTVTQEDNAAFCALTANTQPLHLDLQKAQAAGFPNILVNGLYTFSRAVGMSVPDLTEGTLIANLGYSDVRHPAPVFPGDELRVQTTVVDARESSKPGRGIVTFETTVSKAEEPVCQFRRAALMRRSS